MGSLMGFFTADLGTGLNNSNFDCNMHVPFAEIWSHYDWTFLSLSSFEGMMLSVLLSDVPYRGISDYILRIYP